MPLDRLKSSIKRLLGRSFDTIPDPIDDAGYQIACLDTFPADNDHLLGNWRSLADREGTPLQGPLWQKAVHDTQAQPGRYRLITVSERDTHPAILPLHLRDDGLLETLAPGVSDYLDPLVASHCQAEVWPLLLQYLASMRSDRFPAVTFHNVRESSPARTLLPQLAPAAGFAYEEAVVEHCPLLTLPKSWDAFLDTLEPHERKETRRKYNKAYTKANARTVRCSADPGEIKETVATALSLMEQAPGEKGEAVKKTLRPLLEAAAPAMIPAGQMWLTTLYLNDKPAACTIQFVPCFVNDAAQFRPTSPNFAGPLLYNCGFDATQKEFSPGVVLVAETIRQAIEFGAPTYDLLRGQEPYKYRLGAVDRPLYRITLKKL